MSQIKVFYQGNLMTRCVHVESGSQVVTHPLKEAFSPLDLFAASLGSCVLTVMGLLAEKLGVDLSGAQVLVLKEMSKMPPKRIAALTVQCKIPQRFSREIEQKLEEAGIGCPVHHSLHPEMKVEFSFQWGALS